VKAKQQASFKKTEKVLYCYPIWLTQVEFSERTRRMCELIEKALAQISNDRYYDIIELKYFKKYTHEQLAEYFDINVSVISRHRTRLINELRPIIFSDEYIQELFETS
jgi:RNA polymerase sigma factor (sigma-70 family)